ncbi:MAG TPA: hypothetical protein VFR04_01810 [Solirubrobacterales bacterium]|nr:hypothetical protein [Solirubrobacterales bacterium]
MADPADTKAMRAPASTICVLVGLLSAALAWGTPAALAAPAGFAGASSDGETAFFTTTDQLVPGDTDTRADVYERSYDDALERYVTRQISTGPTGGNDAYPAIYVGISANGAKAFFATEESLVAGDHDLREDIYVRDLAVNATELVSAGDPSCAAQDCGNGDVPSSFAQGGVVAGGEWVFFRSAEQLSNADGDSSVDVYVRDLDAGTTTLVSAGAADCAAAGCGEEDFPASFRGASADGTTAFVTTEESLASADDDALLDIYARDIGAGTTTLVSIAGTCPAGADCSASYGGASSDGSRVYFETAERLTPSDSDSSQDVYDWSAGSATLLSAGPSGGNGEVPAIFAAASSDGATVFFETTESLIGADSDSDSDIYGRSGGVTTLISVGPVGGDGPSPASLRWVSPDGSSAGVLFSTDEALTADDLDGSQDVYERVGGVTTLRSTGAVGGNAALNASFAGASADAIHVFIVTAEQLVAGDSDGALDVYENAAGTTTLVSTGPLAGKTAVPAGLPAGAVAADGSHAFFITEERVTEGDLDAETDVYDRFGGNTLLVSTGNAAPLGPPTPSQLSTDPASPGTSQTPRVRGQSDPNTAIKLYSSSDCSGVPVATGTSLELGGAGILAPVAPGSTTSFRATATDVNGDTSPCSAPVSYTHQASPPPPPPPPPPSGEGGGSGAGPGGSSPGAGGTSAPGGKKGEPGLVYVVPHTRITFAPASKTRARRPVFRFTDSTGQEGTSFRCKVDRGGWRSCGSPLKLKRLDLGQHVLQVKAFNAVGTAEPAPVQRRFKVVGR